MTIIPESLPFALETELEYLIAADLDWQRGVEWGKPRQGHPEGKVLFHVHDVLQNVDRYFADSPDRWRLRLIALLHDSFKFQAKASHGLLARQFGVQYVGDTAVLEVIELHDDAYRAFRLHKRNRQIEATERIEALIQRLGSR